VVDPTGKILENSRFHETITAQLSQWMYEIDTPIARPDVARAAVTALHGSGAGLQVQELLTTPPTVAAYSLSLKDWGLIDIEAVKPITWQENTFDLLQMDVYHKRVVRGIIESHHASFSSFDDFIPGKGRGLVFLLYGPPGCGKTMTAGMCSEKT
jgi:hypothetical protein